MSDFIPSDRIGSYVYLLDKVKDDYQVHLAGAEVEFQKLLDKVNSCIDQAQQQVNQVNQQLSDNEANLQLSDDDLKKHKKKERVLSQLIKFLDRIKHPFVNDAMLDREEVLRIFVQVALPKGHPLKFTDTLLVHGPERLGKSMAACFPLVLIQMAEFKALANHGRPEQDQTKFFNGNYLGGPYVKNELNSMNDNYCVLQDIFGIESNFNTVMNKNSPRYAGTYAFGYNATHYDRLVHVCEKNESSGSKISTLLGVDEGDQVQGSEGVIHHRFEEVRQKDIVGGTIFITATDHSLYNLGRNKFNKHTFQVIDMVPGPDYFGLCDIEGEDLCAGPVKAYQFDVGVRPKHKKGEAKRADPMDKFIEVKTFELVRNDSRNLVRNTLGLAGMALFIADKLIERNMETARTMSAKFPALCVAVCDTGRFHFFWLGVQLNVGFDKNSTFPDALTKAMLHQDVLDSVNSHGGTYVPPICIFAGQMAKRGFTFQTSFQYHGINYLTYVKCMVYDFYVDKKGNMIQALENAKQTFMRFAGVLDKHLEVIDSKADLGIKVFVRDLDVVRDFKICEGALEEMRMDRQGEFTELVRTKYSHAKRKMETELVEGHAIKVPRIDAGVEDEPDLPSRAAPKGSQSRALVAFVTEFADEIGDNFVTAAYIRNLLRTKGRVIDAREYTDAQIMGLAGQGYFPFGARARGNGRSANQAQDRLLASVTSAIQTMLKRNPDRDMLRAPNGQFKVVQIVRDFQ